MDKILAKSGPIFRNLSEIFSGVSQDYSNNKKINKQINIFRSTISDFNVICSKSSCRYSKIIQTKITNNKQTKNQTNKHFSV